MGRSDYREEGMPIGLRDTGGHNGVTQVGHPSLQSVALRWATKGSVEQLVPNAAISQSNGPGPCVTWPRRLSFCSSTLAAFIE